MRLRECVAVGVIGVVSSAGAQTLGDAAKAEQLRRDTLTTERHASASATVDRRVLNVAEADYPSAAWNGHIEGVVDLLALVGEDGSVLDVQIPLDGGYRPFREAADKAVRMHRQSPVVRNGMPAKAWIPIRACFKLR